SGDEEGGREEGGGEEDGEGTRREEDRREEGSGPEGRRAGDRGAGRRPPAGAAARAPRRAVRPARGGDRRLPRRGRRRPGAAAERHASRPALRARRPSGARRGRLPGVQAVRPGGDRGLRGPHRRAARRRRRVLLGPAAAARGTGVPPARDVRGDGAGDRGRLPFPAHARRVRPAPDRRGPARGAVDGARRAPDDAPGRGRYPLHGVGAERAGRAARRGLHPLGRHGVPDAVAGLLRGVGAVPAGRRRGHPVQVRDPLPVRPPTLRADPMARRTEEPPATSSIVTSSHYEWGDAQWLERRAEVPVHEAPFSVYEVHLPSWRPGLSYRELAEQLPAYVKDLGFTHVELMPVAEHPFGPSWGYQVTGFYAPTARLGTPDDFRYLVDALHRAGIGVIMDWVPAHFPKDDWALAEFDGRPLYEPGDSRRAEHPDWGTYTFDFARTEVRNFLVANALYWCQEFHIDGLRVDAVASMLYLDYSREPGQWTPNEHGGRENLDAVAFLQEMNATVYRRCPGVVTIAEESTAWDGVTRATHHEGPSGFGGLGFGLKWNMGWMHDSLQYMSHDPIHRKYHHHEMTFSMVYAYSENYVLPISHDEVVHGKRSLVSKMPGDWWQQRANLRAYLGFMWSHPGKQLLFMGQEFAQGAEWSEARGPDWWLLDPDYGAQADHRGVRDLVRDLNTVYRHTPALWRRDTEPDGFRWVAGDAAEDDVLAFLRYDGDGSPLLAVCHFAPVVRHAYRIGVPDDVPAWHEVLNTDDGRYGGSGVTRPDPVKPEAQGWHGLPASIRLTLPPLATVWLRPA
ncbi:LOW QUALITY PROTEIN: glycogen branching enzyme, partial [Streptomyces viridosporus ATCC 14672]